MVTWPELSHSPSMENPKSPETPCLNSYEMTIMCRIQLVAQLLNRTVVLWMGPAEVTLCNGSFTWYGTGQGQGPGNNGFLCYPMYCTYYRGTEIGKWNHCYRPQMKLHAGIQPLLQRPPGTPPVRHPLADTPWGRHPVRHPTGRHPPGRHHPGRHPLGRHPPSRWPLLQTVRILLECILVFNCAYTIPVLVPYSVSEPSVR